MVEAVQKKWPDAEVKRCGEKIATVVVNGTQIEFYRTTLDTLGAQLLYTTGSAE